MPGAVAADGATMVESGHVSTNTVRSNRSQIGFRIPVSTAERERERFEIFVDQPDIDVSSLLTLSTVNDV